jgi:hypothetical protein
MAPLNVLFETHYSRHRLAVCACGFGLRRYRSRTRRGSSLGWLILLSRDWCRDILLDSSQCSRRFHRVLPTDSTQYCCLSCRLQRISMPFRVRYRAGKRILGVGPYPNLRVLTEWQNRATPKVDVKAGDGDFRVTCESESDPCYPVMPAPGPSKLVSARVGLDFLRQSTTTPCNPVCLPVVEVKKGVHLPFGVAYGHGSCRLSLRLIPKRGNLRGFGMGGGQSGKDYFCLEGLHL